MEIIHELEMFRNTCFCALCSFDQYFFFSKNLNYVGGFDLKFYLKFSGLLEIQQNGETEQNSSICCAVGYSDHKFGRKKCQK